MPIRLAIRTIVQMRIVTDTRVLLAVALDEPEKIGLIRATHGAEQMSPKVLPFEISNALSAMIKRRSINTLHVIEP